MCIGFAAARPLATQNLPQSAAQNHGTSTDALYPLAGIVLVFACLGVAGWNEYRNVAQMQTLAAGRESFVQATCAIDTSLEKKLVHVSCDLKNVSHLGREIDGLRFKSASDMTGLTLQSTVEVYAWMESISEFASTLLHSSGRMSSPRVRWRPVGF